MSDPTPAEIETGATALNGPLVRYGAVQQGYRRTVAEAVLRAVLPGHDARLRAQVLHQAARDIRWRLCGGHRTLSYTDGASDAARLLENLATDTEAAVARAHTTGGDHD